jgi:hypothetical protein
MLAVAGRGLEVGRLLDEGDGDVVGSSALASDGGVGDGAHGIAPLPAVVAGETVVVVAALMDVTTPGRDADAQPARTTVTARPVSRRRSIGRSPL